MYTVYGGMETSKVLIASTSFFEWPFLHRLFVQAQESLGDVETQS